MKVLVLAAHPILEASVVCRKLLAGVRREAGISVVDLYERYPDFNIDVPAEQKRLEAADVIIFQHPFYWYSTPAILKEWTDLVLEHGWAYGRGGTALEGKFLMNALSTGGSADAYGESGTNRYTIPEFLVPIAQSAALCRMTYLPPYVVFEGRRLERQALAETAGLFKDLLCGLRDDRIDPKALARYRLANNAAGKLYGPGAEGAGS